MRDAGEPRAVPLPQASGTDDTASRLLRCVATLLNADSAPTLDQVAALIPLVPALPAGTRTRVRAGSVVAGDSLPADGHPIAVSFSVGGRAEGAIEVCLPARGASDPAIVDRVRDALKSVARIVEAAMGGAGTRHASGHGLRDFERALQEMADTVAVHTGQAYHEELAKYLSCHFGLNIALVGMLDDAGEHITTLAMAEDGAAVPNITYPLAGTPCQRVIKENAGFYGQDIQTLFPEDRWFEVVGAQGYAGVRLLDEQGKPIGIISAISRNPLPNLAAVQSFFKLAASRASAEVDRTRKLAAVQASELRYSLAESGTADGLWDLDLTTDRVYYSPRVAELFGLSPTELGDRPDGFWSRVHPDDLPRALAVRQAHFEKGSPLDIQCRVRHATGIYRWFRVRAKAMRDERGAPVRLTGGITDITEGKRHQAQLKAENAWLAKFVESPPLETLLETIASSGQALFEDAAFELWLLDRTAELRIFPAAHAERCNPSVVRRLFATLPDEGAWLDRRENGWPRQDERFERMHVVPVCAGELPERVAIAVSWPADVPQQPHERDLVAAAERLIRLALDHLRKEAELERQRRLFENLFECAPEAMVILDRHDCVLKANPAFTEVFHYASDEVLGRPLNDLVVPPEFAHEAERLSADAMRGTTVARESFRRRKDGSLVPVSILGAPITVGGIAASYFAIYRDRSTLHEATRRLDHQSRHDQLTGLPDRYEFERRLRQAMSLSADGQGYTGVVYFDLDQFKVVNDTAGHAQGDALLKEVVRRLRPLVPAPHQLARLGGDEFCVLLINGRRQDCEHLAQQIRDCLAGQPFRLGERTFGITASFGIVAVHAGSQWQPQDVLSLADSTCFLAKERGRNRVQVYDPGDTGVTQRREEMGWISRISEALVEQRFRLYHQRIVPADDRCELRHHEILLRMVDRDGELVPPGVFIPPAERYNLMPRIDRWVFESVFSRLHALGRAAQENLLVAVNVSGSTLSDETLPDFVRRLFDAHAVKPACICFEITETAAIANFDAALAFIEVVRELGCRVALDDFGSGLSSFRYLKQIAPDFLKIDGSFVREIARSRTDYSMVEAIHRIGKIIGIRTVAEFVEDDSVLEALRRIGVDYAQGYALHRPEPWNA